MENIINEKYKAMREKVLALKPEIDAHVNGEELSPTLKKEIGEVKVMLEELHGLVVTYERSLRP